MTWQAKAGRALGEKYRNDPRGCQDYALAWAETGKALAVACDGAGSSSQSHIASKAVAKGISEYFHKEDIPKSSYDLSKQIIAVLKKTLSKLCGGDSSKLEDFHTTVLFAFLFQGKYYLGHIGDGLIVGIKPDGLEVLSESQTGDGGSNQTYFAAHAFSRSNLLRIKTGDANPYIGFMCFSDGVEDYVSLQRKALKDFYNRQKKEPLHPDLITIFNNITKIDLSSIIKERWIDKEHTDDDCCLAIIKDPDKNCNLDFTKEHKFYEDALEFQKKKILLRPISIYPEIPSLPYLHLRVHLQYKKTTAIGLKSE